MTTVALTRQGETYKEKEAGRKTAVSFVTLRPSLFLTFKNVLIFLGHHSHHRCSWEQPLPSSPVLDPGVRRNTGRLGALWPSVPCEQRVIAEPCALLLFLFGSFFLSPCVV